MGGYLPISKYQGKRRYDMISGGENVINIKTGSTMKLIAASPHQVMVMGKRGVGKDGIAERKAEAQYQVDQMYKCEQYLRAIIAPLAALASILLARHASSFLINSGYASSMATAAGGISTALTTSYNVGSLAAAGAYGFAAIAGIGLGAGIYYSGAGEYIGTTQLGELIAEGLYGLTHDEAPAA